MQTGDKVRMANINLFFFPEYRNGEITEVLGGNMVMVRWPRGLNGIQSRPSKEWVPNLTIDA